MHASTLAQLAPTATDMAMNALIYGYAGHSLVTPHAALKQLWWTDDRIEAKVTRRFVISKLRGEEREFLRHRLAFAGDLTDRTYLDCILDNTKRLFLVLAEIGAPDQIFGCIDDGWTDEDLPIALEDVSSLELSYKPDDALNQRFYKTQFMFLLRTLTPGSHVEFGPQEHIPIDMVNTLPPAVNLQSWDRMHFPGEPGKTFVRRRFLPPAGVSEADFRKQFRSEVKQAQQLPHEHIASAWASYVSDGASYVLSDFVPEHTLHTFLEHRTPMQLMRLAPERRPVLLCEWMHCLADAVAYLHTSDVVHGAIKPSNIIIDQHNKIAFADIGTLNVFQLEKKRIKHESRDYRAPELALTKDKALPGSPTSSRRFSFRSIRKLSISSTSSSRSASSGGYDSACASTEISRPASSDGPFELPADLSTLSGYIDDAGSAKSEPLLKRIIKSSRQPRSEPPCSLRSYSMSATSDGPSSSTPPAVDLPAADIFSLGCIFLDIITFVLRGKLNDFIKFRSAKNRAPDGRITMDSSFHADPAKVEAWMDTLEEESWQYGEAIYGGMPDLLRLVRRMLASDPALRPDAYHVRERVGDVLAITCGVEDLCCADRVWPMPTFDCSITHGEYSPAYPASSNLFQVRQSCIAA